MKPSVTGIIGMALAAIAILPSLSFAQGITSVTCTTSISGTVNANVVIPKGAQCAFTPNATINGNVSVGSGATLLAGQGVIISQNLEADKDSLVLLGPAAKLNGNYGASGATSAILESSLAQNATFNGGSYAILGNLVGSVTCGGGSAGAIATTIGVLNSGCTIDTPLTVLGNLATVADKASGGGSGTGLTCDQLNIMITFFSSLAAIENVLCDKGNNPTACVYSAYNLGRAAGLTEAYNPQCTTTPIY